MTTKLNIRTSHQEKENASQIFIFLTSHFDLLNCNLTNQNENRKQVFFK